MSKNPLRWLLTMLALLTIAILISFTSQVVANVSGSTLDSFVSPIVTPIISPTLVPPTSQLTELALKHISDRVGIPIERLLLSNAYRRDYPSLGRSFWAVTALDARGDDWYKVMVDLADGSIIDRIEDIEQAAQQAQQARYGKLEPALFDRLQTMKPNDEVKIAIWVAGKPRRSREELYAALAAKYPEAKAALERSGKPFDVGDPQLGNALEAEYTRMVEEDEAALTQPLINTLRGRGYDVTALRAMPAVAAKLPKSIILEIASWPNVQKIYLDDDKQKPAVDSAVPTDRVPVVWQRGFKGSGVSIGILEPGRVGFTGPAGHNYLHQGEIRPCSGEGSGAVTPHKTWVASVAASYQSTYTGVAPDATIHDACTNVTGEDTIAGLAWATDRIATTCLLDFAFRMSVVHLRISLSITIEGMGPGNALAPRQT